VPRPSPASPRPRLRALAQTNGRVVFLCWEAGLALEPLDPDPKPRTLVTLHGGDPYTVAGDVVDVAEVLGLDWRAPA
jgi:hypothetical protein